MNGLAPRKTLQPYMYVVSLPITLEGTHAPRPWLDPFCLLTTLNLESILHREDARSYS